MEPPACEGTLGGLQSPGSSDLPDAGEAREEACRVPGGGMDAAAAGSDSGCPRALASTEQSDLVCMDLDEAPEAHLGREEWAETVGEDGQSEIQGLLTQLQSLSPSFHDDLPASEGDPLLASDCGAGPHGGEVPLPHRRAVGCCQGLPGECSPCLLHVATGRGLGVLPCRARCSTSSRRSHGLLFAEADREDLLSLLHHEGGLPAEGSEETPLARSDSLAGSDAAALLHRESPVARQMEEAASQAGSPQAEGSCRWYRTRGACEEDPACATPGSRDSSPEPVWAAMSAPPSQGPEQAPHGSTAAKEALASYPAFKEVAGPCEPEDLLDGVIFGAKYLGSTQLVSERNPPTSVHMAQAQEAMDRVKAPDGESQPMTEVDLFVSTQRIKVLTADSQKAMMDHPLQTISYIADIGTILVVMARRKLPRRADASGEKRLYKMICHVFHSTDAQLIAQAIGQAFSLAYQQVLQASGIDPSQLPPRQDSCALESRELHNGDLAHFSKQENCRDICIHKQKGEILGVAVVESGWGSILPTVVIANLMHGGPAEKCGELSIGDRLMSVNGTSLVGLPLGTCQNVIRDLKSQTEVTLSIVHCPPVTTAIVRRPDSKYPLGFCVEDGIICSLMRGGIAERGGIRVGHRIIEINGRSVVATPHEKIIQILTQAVSEVHIKTMPASTYRLLTGQEQPIFL
uniref:Amyloid-beta A4 precursor protein-binding family A member 3 n=1 Tax=Pelodiscus sinensis TaxID=13735 RepID=K7G511_PELSI|nr:amyloid-beta A4 precursor protein-binding family A member 3 [Pelodiscus sinensis]|eukprot:XP_006132662.1 amyloid-beta A4 precursor protein-binding family A member 3 [Pelodiscus sinensis]